MCIIATVLYTRPELDSDRNVAESFVHAYNNFAQSACSIQYCRNTPREQGKILNTNV